MTKPMLRLACCGVIASLFACAAGSESAFESGPTMDDEEQRRSQPESEEPQTEVVEVRPGEPPASDPCTTSPCENGGSCVVVGNGFVCSCVEGYEGPTCSAAATTTAEVTVIDPCTAQPCRNGGQCTAISDTFACQCLSGFEGALCEVDIDECAGNPCQNGGRCIDQSGGFSCACPEFFEGMRCETALPNLAFVTSAEYPGDLGGIEGADAICQNHAEQAGLAGTYLSFLATASSSARSRFERVRGWARTDGKPLIDDGIFLFRMIYPLRFDEFGRDVEGGVEVWTGEAWAWSRSVCDNWTSASPDLLGTVGRADASEQYFAMAGERGCDEQRRLYCFGVDREASVAPEPVAGRLAFTTDGYFSIGGGLAAADALCQSEADQANVVGTFLALLPTTTASAASRFDLTGPPWVRPDGVPLAVTAAEVFNHHLLDAPPAMRLDGTPLIAHRVWTGSVALDDAGLSCADWSSVSPEFFTWIGTANFTFVPDLLGYRGIAACSTPEPARLICFQSDWDSDEGI